MKIFNNRFFALAMICLCLFACSSRTAATKQGEPNPETAQIIALMPVEGQSVNSAALKILRNKFCDEIRFKGYPQIESNLIDDKLITLTGEKELKNSGVVSPKTVEQLVGADAVMYCSILEGKMSTGMFYAPVTVSVRCALRSARTGEIIWSAQSKSTGRSFDLFRNRLQMKAIGDLEKAMDEVVSKMMETLPDGPKLRG